MAEKADRGPDRPRTGGQSGSLPTGQGPDIERTGEGVRQKRPDRVSGQGPDRGAVPQNGRTAHLSGICPGPVRVPVCRTAPCPDPVRDPCPGVFVFSLLLLLCEQVYTVARWEDTVLQRHQGVSSGAV